MYQADSEQDILTKIRTLTENQLFRDNIKKFQKRSIDSEKSYEDVDIIESFIP